MRSKTSFFNRSVFLKNIGRFWPIWAAYLIINLILPINFLTQTQQSVSELADLINSVAPKMMYITSFCVSIITAMAVYSYMYNNRSTGFFHSLPLSRTAIFVSSYLSGLAMLFGVNVLTCAAYLPNINVFADISVDIFKAASVLLAKSCISSFYFFSFATLCAMFTGHIIALPVFYGVFSFLPICIELLIKFVFRAMIFGLTPLMNRSGFAAIKFTPIIKLLVNSEYIEEYVNGETICYYAGTPYIYVLVGAAVLFAAISLFMYKKRRSEAASDVVSVRWGYPIFKYGVMLCSAFLFGVVLCVMICNSMSRLNYAALTVCMAVCGAAGYLAAEMIIRKTFKVFNGRNVLGLVCSLAFIVIFNVCMRGDVFGIEKYVPDAADVLSVSIAEDINATAETDDAQTISAVTRLHSAIVENSAELKKTSGDDIRYSDGYGYQPFYITYSLKNGKKVERYYDITYKLDDLADESSVAYKLKEAINSPAAIKARMSFGDISTGEFITGYLYGDGNLIKEKTAYEDVVQHAGKDGVYEYFNADVPLERDECEKLYQAVLADAEEGNIGRTMMSGDDTDVSFLDLNVSISFYREENGKYDHMSIYTLVLKESSHTLEALRQMGYLNTDELSKQLAG